MKNLDKSVTRKKSTPGSNAEWIATV